MRSLIMCVLFVLAGCATTYEDQRVWGGLFGGGWQTVSAFKITELNQSTLRIESKGNGFNTKSEIRDFAFLRAAEEAISRDYQWFDIVESESFVRQVLREVPATSRTNFDAGVSITGRVSGTATTVYEPARTEIVAEHPRTNLIVRFFREPLTLELDRQYLYSAKSVYNSLGPNYIKEFTPLR